MTRLGIVFWLLLVLGTGFTTFKVKYAVQDIEDELTRVRKQTIAEQQEIRVLNAEWTYLNQPERLAELNRRFLNLAPVATKQLQQRIADLPLRPPPPPAQPDLLIATNETADQPSPHPSATPAPLAATATAMAPAAVAPATESQPQVPGSLDALIAANLETDPAVASALANERVVAPAVTPAVRALTALAIAPAAAAATPSPIPPTKTGLPQLPGSLDALIAQIADAR